jgi:hypothetical protein
LTRSTPDFNARNVEASNAFVGNEAGVVAPIEMEYQDVDRDSLQDLRLYYDAESAREILAGDGVTAGLRYGVRRGDSYLVADIFALGTPIAIRTSGATADAGEIAVVSPRPNPFRSSTTIHYSVRGTGGRVKIVVHDASGRFVRTLIDATQAPGVHMVTWDGRHEEGARAVTGVYFLRADVAGRRHSDRLIRG